MAIKYNPLDPVVRIDPYPHYRQLRSEDPVHWSEIGDVGVWVLSRYADVVSVLRDSRFSADRSNSDFAQQQLESGAIEDNGVRTMLDSDPPDHTRLRNLVSKAFTPRRVESMRPHIQEIVDSLLDAVQEHGRMDMIRDLAYPLPVIVIAEMLGVPPEDRDRFKTWSDDIAATVDFAAPPEVQEKAKRSSEELREYLRGVVEERRKEPKDDLISALIAAEEQGDELSEDELYATCNLLLVAGNETTTNLIGNGLLALLRHPEQLQKLTADLSLIEAAVEELLRYDSPVQATSRVAMAKVEIGGHMLKKGQSAVTLLGAANRDPDQFSEPDTLDITRQENRHVSFGHGNHFCLGAPLARVEAQIAIESLLRRMPELRLQTEAPEWREAVILRGLKSLPVSFEEVRS